MNELTIEYVQPDTLRSAPWNPRKITPQVLARLVKLLDQHGFVDPVLARAEDRLILGGHQRIRANRLRENPQERVPVIFLTGISDERAKALNIALNNPAAQGQYDLEALSELLRQIELPEMDLPALTGFSEGDLDQLTRSLDDLEPVGPISTPPGQGASGGGGVILIFEMSSEQYRKVKDRFDRLIAAEGLTCHVRIEDSYRGRIQ